jgi:hypothetical protein
MNQTFERSLQLRDPFIARVHWMHSENGYIEYANDFSPPLEKEEVEFATDRYLKENDGFELDGDGITYKNVESVLKIVRDTRAVPA